MKFAVVDRRKEKRKLFGKSIITEEINYKDKSFYYIKIFGKKAIPIKKIKNLMIKLNIEEIIFKGDSNDEYILKDNNIKFLDIKDFKMECICKSIENIYNKIPKEKRMLNILFYDPLFKYAKSSLEKLLPYSKTLKLYTIKNDEAVELKNELMEKTGFPILYTDYIEKIENYNIIIISTNSKGFFMDREICGKPMIFSMDKIKSNYNYSIIDTVYLKLPKDVEKLSLMNCNFELLCAFKKYNFISKAKIEITSYAGYDSMYTSERLANIIKD